MILINKYQLVRACLSANRLDTTEFSTHRRFARAGMVLFTSIRKHIAVMNTAEMVIQDSASLGRLK